MPDFPMSRWGPLNVINPWSWEALGSLRGNNASSLNSVVSSTLTANVVYPFPFRLYMPATAVKMSVLVGATPTGNVDVGIYDWGWNRIVVSGSQAQGTANQLQEIDITDTLLAPGDYFMAIQPSGAATVFAITAVDELQFPAWPVYLASPGSFGLPATIAPGLTSGATPFTGIAMGVHFDTLV